MRRHRLQHRDIAKALTQVLQPLEVDELAVGVEPIEHFVEQPGVPAQARGGQQQRLCIARGVSVKPSILLLDEPTSALDPISTAKVEELVHELKKDYTIAIVTHNMQQAARVSDFTAYMYLGEMMEFGKTDEIFLKPKRKETEDYITGRFG